VTTDGKLRADTILFSESQSRLLVTVRPDNRVRFEAQFAGLDAALIGEVTLSPQLWISDGGRTLIQSDINTLKEAWQAPLREL
jgi:phosphoribosylformylglycinamidine synthase